jgi:hypothetical protein
MSCGNQRLGWRGQFLSRIAPPACELALCDSRATGASVPEGLGGMAIALNGEDIAASGWVDRSTWSLLSGPWPGPFASVWRRFY